MANNDTAPAPATDPMALAHALGETANDAVADAQAASRAIRAAHDAGHPDDSAHVATLRATARAAWATADAATAAEREERDRVRRTPILGGPATICYPSDCYPAVVTRVTATQVDVTMVEHDATGWPVSEGEGDLSRPIGGPRRFTLRARTGRWIGVGGSERDGVSVSFGTAYYRRNHLD